MQTIRNLYEDLFSARGYQAGMPMQCHCGAPGISQGIGVNDLQKGGETRLPARLHMGISCFRDCLK